MPSHFSAEKGRVFAPSVMLGFMHGVDTLHSRVPCSPKAGKRISLELFAGPSVVLLVGLDWDSRRHYAICIVYKRDRCGVLLCSNINILRVVWGDVFFSSEVQGCLFFVGIR